MVALLDNIFKKYFEVFFFQIVCLFKTHKTVFLTPSFLPFPLRIIMIITSSQSFQDLSQKHSER